MVSNREIFEKLNAREPKISPKSDDCVKEFINEALNLFGLKKDELSDYESFKSKVQDIVSNAIKRYERSANGFKAMMKNGKNTVSSLSMSYKLLRLRIFSIGAVAKLRQTAHFIFHGCRTLPSGYFICCLYVV